MRRFQEKTVLVTGGAAGIGRAVVSEFLKEGANVVFADINREQGELYEVELSKGGRRAFFFHGDMSNEEQIKAFVFYSISKFSSIDVLVNNIGIFNGSGLNASEKEWHDCFQTNVVSHFLCTKHCVPELAKSGNGAIVNISSISGVIAQPGYILYNTTKAALVNMTRCLALDLAKDKIRVNNVCPGTVWTESNAYYIHRDNGVDYEGANKHPDIGGKHPIGRIALPGEIARAVLFLASQDASFITGENLMVDGGYTIV